EFSSLAAEVDYSNPVLRTERVKKPQSCLIDLLTKVDGRTRSIQHHHQTERRVSRLEVHDGKTHAIFIDGKVALRQICNHTAPLIDDTNVELDQRGIRRDYFVRCLRARNGGERCESNR